PCSLPVLPSFPTRRSSDLVDHRVHVRVVDGQRLVEQRATERGLEEDRLTLLPALGCLEAGDRRDEVRRADLDLGVEVQGALVERDRKSTRLNSSHVKSSYA